MARHQICLMVDKADNVDSLCELDLSDKFLVKVPDLD
jgi:hypothetical protein